MGLRGQQRRWSFINARKARDAVRWHILSYPREGVGYFVFVIYGECYSTVTGDFWVVVFGYGVLAVVYKTACAAFA